MVGIPLGGVTKPNPEAFIQAVKDYHLDYQKVAYFGDSTTDIQTAHNLNVKTICSVLWGYQTLEQLKEYPIQPNFYLRDTKAKMIFHTLEKEKNVFLFSIIY